MSKTLYVEAHDKHYDIVSLFDIFNKTDFRIVPSFIPNGKNGMKLNPYKTKQSCELFFSIDNRSFNDKQEKNKHLENHSGYVLTNLNNFVNDKTRYMCIGEIGSITFINWGEHYLFMIKDKYMIASYKCLVTTEDIKKMFYNESEV